MLTPPARPVLGLVSFAVAGSLLAGCTGDPEPATTSGPSVGSTSPQASPAPSTSGPTPTGSSASPTAGLPTVGGGLPRHPHRLARGAVRSRGRHSDPRGQAAGDRRLRPWPTARTRKSSSPPPTAAPPRCSPSVTTTGSAVTRPTGSRRPVMRRPRPTLVGKYAPITESDATELGSFTLRSILTELFALPELALLESEHRPGDRDRGRRPRGLPARQHGRPAPVGGRRRQRDAAAGRRGEERAVGPQVLRVGPRGDVHRATALEGHRGTDAGERADEPADRHAAADRHPGGLTARR